MKKIFIVEDDDGIRELVEFLLESEGYSVEAYPTASSFQKAVTENNPPDLFLLDIMLPDGNGIDLCNRLKETERTRAIPVILMSAHANMEIREGANDFIAKPFDVEELVQRIERQLI